MKIGSHVGMSGKTMLLGSVQEALSYGANCFMVYTGAPQNTIRKKVDELQIPAAHELMELEGLNLNDCVVHAPYIVNLANPDLEKQEFAVRFLTEEVRRTQAMGIKQMILHPGAHVQTGVDMAIENIVKGLNKIIENTIDLDVIIALETMAGKGTEMGRNFDEIKRIIEGCKYPERLGVCFDTCHVSDSGYDLKNNYEAVFAEFDQKVGLGKITAFHINDSKNQMGASKDRHENLGLGYLGFDALRKIVTDERFANVPKFLESPYVASGTSDKSYAPYKFEIEMLKSGVFVPDFTEIIRKNND